MKTPFSWVQVALCLLLGISAGLHADTPPAAPPPAAAVTPDFGRPGNVFFVGDPVSVKLKGSGTTRYEVRNYDGKVVDSGDVTDPLTLKVTDPGWYKLYLYKGPGADDGLASATFVVFRKDTNFPDLPAGASEQAMRGAFGLGPARLTADASHPDAAIKALDPQVALAKKYYVPYDATRKRVLIVSIPDSTFNPDGLRKIVTHFKGDVTYWELRTDPAKVSGTDFATQEIKVFADIVKGVDPNLKVLGPGGIGLHLSDLKWIDDFLKNDGAKSLDGFSFGSDDAVVGDLWLTRISVAQIAALLALDKAAGLEKWQTGGVAPVVQGGVYEPLVQGRWAMLQAMVYETLGIPKEHDVTFNDKGSGWANADGSPNPAAALMRVWSEEIAGTTFTRALDFGQQGNDLYAGDLFTGGDKRVAAFVSAGSTDRHVMLKIKGTDKLHTVSAFGVTADVPVVNGEAALLVPMLPVYVELAPGQTMDVEPVDWGPNFALFPEVVAETDGSPEYPGDKTVFNDAGKVINGTLESEYYGQTKDSRPWTSNVTQFPTALTLTWPEPTILDRVNVFAAPPWQAQGTLLDYELQYDKDDQWVTIEHVQEPATVVKAATAATNTTWDNYASDRWVFQHHFPAVTTRRLRLLIHDATYGGDPTKDLSDASAQAAPHQVTLREIQVFGPTVPGLRGEYFSGENFNSKFLTRTDQTVNFPNWWTAEPSLYHKAFSIRWTGSIRPRYSEEYTFFTDADDGVRLWIDGKLLVNNWSDHPNSENGGKIALQAGRVYSVQMEYYENGIGEAGIKLGWVSPSQEREIIPSTLLSSPPVAHLAPPPAPPHPKHPAKIKPKTRHKR